jgi:hypothetical protein
MDAMVGATLQFAMTKVDELQRRTDRGAAAKHCRRHGRRGTSRAMEPAARHLRLPACRAPPSQIHHNAVKYGVGA